MPPTPSPIVDRPIRFALVGCGRVAQNHVAALERLGSRVELVDVCDPDPAALSSMVARTGAAGHASFDALLERTKADVVVLATPSGLHPSQTVRAAERGLSVLTEKPMALRYEDGLAMVEACERAGVRLFVVKQLRLLPRVQRLARAIREGRFGRLHVVAINVFWTRPQAYYDEAAWRGTRALDGGALTNQASHHVDLLTFLGGPVASVQALTATLGRSIEVEDTAALSVRFRSGALGSLNVTMLTYPKNIETSITVLGERGSVRLGGAAADVVEHWEFAEPFPEHDERDATPADLGGGHARYYQDVVAAMRGEHEPSIDGREGLRSLEILTAAYRSADQGRRVDLPLEGG